MIPSQVVLPLDDWVTLLVDDPSLETTEWRAVVENNPTKDSGRELVWEVEAVDPGIVLAFDAPIATDLEAEDSLELDATVATDLESEVNLSLIFVYVLTAASPVIIVIVDVCSRLDFFAAMDTIDDNSYAPTPPPSTYLIAPLASIDQKWPTTHRPTLS